MPAPTTQVCATNVSGYCGKKKNAEADRVDAQQRHEERLADGYGTCESQDLLLDDLAAPNQSASKRRRFPTVWIDRGLVTWDDRTFPEAGSYNQVGLLRLVALRVNCKPSKIEWSRPEQTPTPASAPKKSATNTTSFSSMRSQASSVWDLDSGNLEQRMVVESMSARHCSQARVRSVPWMLGLRGRAATFRPPR